MEEDPLADNTLPVQDANMNITSTQQEAEAGRRVTGDPLYYQNSQWPGDFETSHKITFTIDIHDMGTPTCSLPTGTLPIYTFSTGAAILPTTGTCVPTHPFYTTDGTRLDDNPSKHHLAWINARDDSSHLHPGPASSHSQS